MTRIIGGAVGGRLIAVPASGTRPTSDRVREAMFSALDARVATWSDLHVLDLYAGSGALGLEAASRGAARVTLVESAARAAAVAEQNARDLGMSAVTVVRTDVSRFVSSPPVDGPVGLVLADPPYEVASSVVSEVLGALWTNGWLADGALVVVERSARSLRADRLVWPDGLEVLSERRYGDTALCTGRWITA